MEEQTHDDQNDEFLSKTQLKREMHALQKLGETLCSLKPATLNVLPLSDTLRAAIDDYNRLKAKEAKRRQRQYIGRVMRSEDWEAIQAALSNPPDSGKTSTTPANQERNGHPKHIAQWCERLIAGDDSLYSTLDELNINFNRQKLGQLTRQARKGHRATSSTSHPTTSSASAMARLINWLSVLVKEHGAKLPPPPD